MNNPSLEVQVKADSYAEIKSPLDLERSDAKLYEGGALRPSRGYESIFQWKNLGLAVHQAAMGTTLSTLSGVIYAVFNNYLHMSATLVATATALVAYPRTLRLFTGMLADSVPIFGYRRRPYMVLGWTLTCVSCLLMAVWPLGNPYYSDPSISKLNPSKLTAEQLATIDTDAPQRGIKLIFFMMVANFGAVVAFSGFNGVMMEFSQREPAAVRGTAMGESLVVSEFFSIVSSFFTGLGLNSADYGGSFSWSVGFNGIMGICAGMACLAVVSSWFCIQEEKFVPVRPTKSIFKFVFELLQTPVVYRYVTFRFFYNVFALFSVTASSAIQSTWAKVEPLNNGIAAMLAALLTMLGTYFIKKFGLAWNWRYIIITAQVFVVFVDVFPTMLTTWDVVRSQWFWLGVPLLEKLPDAAADFVTSLLIIEIDDHGYGATIFGLAVTSQRVCTPFATMLTKSVDGYLDIERKYIQKDDHHVRSQVTIAYIIAYAFNLFAIVFVFILPRQKEELHKLQREGKKSKTIGAAAVVVLVFALVWSLMTNILSLFTSTKCLRIAGGSGCK